MREEIEKILDETPYLDYETPDIDSMADQQEYINKKRKELK